VLATSRDSLFAGTSLTLAAAVAGGNGTTPLTWRSTNPVVAGVTSSGVVIALKPGATDIIAQAGAAADTALIVVRSPVQQITLEPGLTSIPLNSSVQFVGTVELNAGAGGIPIPLSWQSSNTSVVSITVNGRATAVAPGNATITVESYGVQASMVLSVAQTSSEIATAFRIEVDVAPSNLTPGQKGQAYAVVYDSLGNALTDQSVTWSTSDPDVAIVSSTGEVTALKQGTADVRASRGGKSGGKPVKVTPQTVARVEVSLVSPVVVGNKFQARATVYDANDKVLLGREVHWSSPNPQIATVGDAGVVTAVSAGTTVIVATVDGVIGDESMTVQSTTPTVATVSVSLASDTISPGASTQATAVARDAAGSVVSGVTFTWTSSNTAVATVNASGSVSAVATGSAIITGTGGGKSGAATVVVKPASTATVSSVTVTLGAASINVGQTTQATATARDATGQILTAQTVTWSIGNGQSVASISSGGVVTGISAGTATVKAAVGGVAGTASISVAGGSTPPPPPPGPAALPQSWVDVSMPTQTGQTISVNAGDNLQLAINNAKPGDVLLLQAGATFTGNLKLPQKSGSGWIVIRTSTPNSQLPPAGTRVTPQHAPLMARIQTNNAGSAISTSAGAAYYRFVGVEITAASSVTNMSALVAIGDGTATQTTSSAVPHHIIFDRVYVHGHSSLDFQRCLALNSAETAVVDSWLSECHSKQFDSQAIAVWNGPGPFKIVNNHVEGSGMAILLGGAMSMANLIPRDFEIRRNYFLKPLNWKGVWAVKNGLEFKTGERILLEENVIDGSWVHAQTGFAMVLISMGAGGQTWHHVGDVTIRSNLIRNVGAGFNIGAVYAGAATPTSRVTIAHNVMDKVNTSATPGEGRMVQILGAVTDLAITHNTFLATTGNVLQAIAFDVAPSVRLHVADNILWRGQYGVFGSGKSEGIPTLTYYAPTGTWANNLMVGTKPSSVSYPATTFWSTLSGVGFVDPAGDFRLGSSSPYRTAATDGSALGTDVATVMSRLSNVIVP
jgi:uncharacterized protein YjdB